MKTCYEGDVDEATETLGGMNAALLRAGFDSVNWREIAEHYIGKLDEQETG